MVILGIDPGVQTIGYGIIQLDDNHPSYIASGVIKTLADEDMHIRLAEIYRDMKELVDAYKPSVVAIERLFFFYNTSSAMQVSQARGVIMAALPREVEIEEYTPSAIKKQICGDGCADKKLIRKAVHNLLGIDIAEDNSCDAVAIGLTYALRQTRRKTQTARVDFGIATCL